MNASASQALAILLLAAGMVVVVGAAGVALFIIGIVRKRPGLWITGLVIDAAVAMLALLAALASVA